MILGASGRLGRALWESRPQTLEVTALTHAELDVTDIRAVEAVIALARPDVVINAAAWTDVAGAQTNAAAARAVNAVAPGAMGRLFAARASGSCTSRRTMSFRERVPHPGTKLPRPIPDRRASTASRSTRGRGSLRKAAFRERSCARLASQRRARLRERHSVGGGRGQGSLRDRLSDRYAYFDGGARRWTWDALPELTPCRSTDDRSTTWRKAAGSAGPIWPFMHWRRPRTGPSGSVNSSWPFASERPGRACGERMPTTASGRSTAGSRVSKRTSFRGRNGGWRVWISLWISWLRPKNPCG